MLHEFTYEDEQYVNWGHPICIPPDKVTDVKPLDLYPLYSGEWITEKEFVLFTMEGDNSLGLGDSIWFINYLRDIYSIKAGARRGNFIFCSSDWLIDFYKQFLPPTFHYQPLYTRKEDLSCFDHVLPVTYNRRDANGIDRSWVDGKSFLERMYNATGMEYNGLSDWREFIPNTILYPPDSFWKDLGISKNERYVYFQWNASGYSKNVEPSQNIEMIKVLTGYGYKVCIIGKGPNVPQVELPNVLNLFNKTVGKAEDLFTLVFHSSLVVTPDSSGLHLAEALRVPCVCLTSILPASYIGNKYKMAVFMTGNNCPHSPCGSLGQLPVHLCHSSIHSKNYCNVLSNIDLNMFRVCVEMALGKHEEYRQTKSINFYDLDSQPITV